MATTTTTTPKPKTNKPWPAKAANVWAANKDKVTKAAQAKWESVRASARASGQGKPGPKNPVKKVTTTAAPAAKTPAK